MNESWAQWWSPGRPFDLEAKLTTRALFLNPRSKGRFQAVKAYILYIYMRDSKSMWGTWMSKW